MNRDRTDVALSLLAGLLREGGATVSTRTNETVPVTGYMVGGVATPLEVKRAELRPSDVVAWLERTDVPTGSYVGAWESDGVLYFDVSQRLEDRGTALHAARARGELAIWDLDNGAEVITPA